MGKVVLAGSRRVEPRRPYWFAMVVCACMVLAPWSGALAMRLVKPGELPRLGAGEGLVVLALEVGAPVSAIRIAEGEGGTVKVLSGLTYGRNIRVYAAKAGDYRWSQLDLFTWSMRSRMTLRSDAFRFRVLPGQMNYPGDLVIADAGWSHASVRVANHALPVMDWLESSHPALARAMPLRYVGLYPDPFPDFYRQARAHDDRPATALNGGREPPAPGALPLPVELLWKPERLAAVSLNAAGDLLAESVRDEGGRWSVEVVDLVAGTRRRLGAFDGPAYALAWKDDRTLIAAAGSGRQRHVVYRLGSLGDANAVQALEIEGAGRIVDLLPSDPESVLFEGLDSRGTLVVHRIRLGGSRSIRSFVTARTRDRLNPDVGNDLAWFSDGSGALRAALAMRDEVPVLLHGRDGDFHEVWRARQEGGFEPAGLSFDGATIYGFTDDGRSQRDLVAFDPQSRQVVRTLFSRPGVDVVGMLVDAHREPVAVRFYASGRLVTEYLQEAGQEQARLLEAAFPGRTVAVIDRSADGSKRILWVDASDQPPRLYFHDAATGRSEMIEEIAPWLSDKTFAPAHVLAATASDGLAVEAFLTLPHGPGRRPLVVYPHGGPIGVADTLHFRRDVQFLASLGYAVLQVNFRGSEGYGRAFREAGMGAFGKEIEDDIDAAVKAALAAHPLDPDRMCVLGASYGGYSAMVSAIRWPDRFKCAVSLSGISDRALVFTSSDLMRDPDVRRQQERWMGDPNVDLARMQEASPLYRVEALELPLMLVHGRDDARVDFEHTRRLVRLLNLRGAPPVVLAFPGMGHSFDDPTALDIAWTGIAGFLRAHLGKPMEPPGAGAGR
ncbi:alpha/beta hydrolase family protein [Marilutibacter aestuarii]|uniref:S9 family peptidase n=1 Tax=Marilutibacter aestuarii TaxID=1706195 RepID=A0A508APD1_9GAMM|nr:alpha/beta fold hydrolase [Lysobacter aestuarii]TQD50803.1 S9 family peptidase [Lysobacter aestuarii]